MIYLQLLKIDLEKIWQTKNLTSTFLLPLSWLFRGVVECRGVYYRYRNSKVTPPNCYTIIVGNISVGGTGKTPFVIWLAKQLLAQHLRVGIVTRGYKRESKDEFIDVQANSSPLDVGDEAVLLAQKSTCPVIVANDRKKAVEELISRYNVDVVLSDDGLQHYNLPRDYEIVLIDGDKGFGNSRCLPAGPLREPISRLNSCDLIVYNGIVESNPYNFVFDYDVVVSLCSDTIRKPLNDLKDFTVHAVAGIGNSNRFFNILKDAGLNIIEHWFSDHHAFEANDIEFSDEFPVIMTEKDAVKCKKFVTKDIWFLPITISVNSELEKQINILIEGISHG